MITRRPIASVIAASASATARRALLAFQQLDAATAPVRLRERAQPRAALRDRAMVVAVDQVDRLELGHAARV